MVRGGALGRLLGGSWEIGSSAAVVGSVEAPAEPWGYPSTGLSILCSGAWWGSWEALGRLLGDWQQLALQGESQIIDHRIAD